MKILLRIGSFYTDLTIISILFFPFDFFALMVDHTEYAIWGLFFKTLFISIFFCRDSFGIRSLGRKIFKLQVINSVGNQTTPSPWRCALRNIFILIAPIEFIFMLFSKGHRRIGDIITNTEVIKINKPVTKFQGKGFLVLFAIWIGSFIIRVLMDTDKYLSFFNS